MSISFNLGAGEFQVKLNKSLYSLDSINLSVQDFSEVCLKNGEIVEEDEYFVINFKSICDESLKEIAYGFTNYVLGTMINESGEDEA